MSADNAAHVTGTNETLLQSHSGPAAETPCEEVSLFSAVTALCGHSSLIPLRCSPFFSFLSCCLCLLATLIPLFPFGLFLLHTPYFCSSYPLRHKTALLSATWPPYSWIFWRNSYSCTCVPSLPTVLPPRHGGCFSIMLSLLLEVWGVSKVW